MNGLYRRGNVVALVDLRGLTRLQLFHEMRCAASALRVSEHAQYL